MCSTETPLHLQQASKQDEDVLSDRLVDLVDSEAEVTTAVPAKRRRKGEADVGGEAGPHYDGCEIGEMYGDVRLHLRNGDLTRIHNGAFLNDCVVTCAMGILQFRAANLLRNLNVAIITSQLYSQLAVRSRSTRELIRWLPNRSFCGTNILLMPVNYSYVAVNPTPLN